MAEPGAVLAAALIAVFPGLAFVLALRPLLGRPGEGALRAAVGLSVGAGVSGLAHVLALLLGGRIVTMLAIESVLLGGALLVGLRSSPLVGTVARPHGLLPRIAGWAALGFSMVVMLLGFSGRAHPFGGWDSWAIWTLHARFLHRGRLGAWTDMFTPVMNWSHPDYPLALPAAIARIWSLSGREGAAAPWIVALVSTLCVPLVVFGVLRAVRGPMLGAIGALAIAATAPIVVVGADQYADVPLAALFAATCGLFVLAHRPEARCRSLLVLAGVAASLGAWTKNEGIPFALVAVAGAFLAGPAGSPWSRARRAGAVLAGAAPGLIALGLFRIFLAPEGTTVPGVFDGFIGRWLDPGRHVTIVTIAGRELLKGHLLVLIAVALAVVVLGPAKPPDRRVAIPVLGFVAAQAAAYYAVYVVTTTDQVWHLNHSVDRLIVHLVPSLLLGLLLLASEPGEPAPSPGRTRGIERPTKPVPSGRPGTGTVL